MIRKPWQSTLAIIAASIGLGSLANAQELTLAQCPPVVQSAIRNNSQGGTLEEIKLVDRDGTSLYVAEVGLGENRDLKMYITADGTVVRSRQEIDFKTVPVPVRRTVLGLLPEGAVVSDCDVETAEGATKYVVEFMISPTRERKLTLGADGTVLSEHEKEKN